jgi:hypothetical protein
LGRVRDRHRSSDIAKYTGVKLFGEVGKKTELLIRAMVWKRDLPGLKEGTR